MKEIIKTLTPDEINWVRQLHPKAEIDPKTQRMILTPLSYITDDHALLLSYWCEHVPFVNAERSEWQIKKECDKIIIRHRKKLHSYHIHTDSGNVKIYNEGRLSNLGTDAYAIQFYMEFNYAYPIYFAPAHWANGRSALELMLAIPDKRPLNALLRLIFDGDQAIINDWYAERQLLQVNLDSLDVYNAEYILLKNRVGIAV